MSMDFAEKYGPCHLADGPTWMCGSEDPLGLPPFGSVTRRAAVLRMSRR